MKLEISGLGTKLTDKQKQYVEKKIGGLEKYIPRAQRGVAHAEVRLKEHKNDGQRQQTCAVELRLPNEIIKISETTVNAFAAIDIVETKLKLAIKKYKDKYASPKLRQRLVRRLGRR